MVAGISDKDHSFTHCNITRESKLAFESSVRTKLTEEATIRLRKDLHSVVAGVGHEDLIIVKAKGVGIGHLTRPVANHSPHQSALARAITLDQRCGFSIEEEEQTIAKRLHSCSQNKRGRGRGRGSCLCVLCCCFRLEVLLHHQSTGTRHKRRSLKRSISKREREQADRDGDASAAGAGAGAGAGATAGFAGIAHLTLGAEALVGVGTPRTLPTFSLNESCGMWNANV